MPRPPILPTIDWPAVFETGVGYEQWIAQAEFEEKVQQTEDIRKNLTLTEEEKQRLSAISRPVHVLAIAEDWCGDVVRNVPALQKLAEFCPNLIVKYVSREQHPDVFVRFLTNGGEAIPKFVFLSEDFVECSNWGPMPEDYRRLIARGKACGNVAAARELVAEKYQQDPERRIAVGELLHLIELASCRTP